MVLGGWGTGGGGGRGCQGSAEARSGGRSGGPAVGCEPTNGGGEELDCMTSH